MLFSYYLLIPIEYHTLHRRNEARKDKSVPILSQIIYEYNRTDCTYNEGKKAMTNPHRKETMIGNGDALFCLNNSKM